MSDVKWIKIITDIFDDEKIRLIETLPDADTVLIIWFKLLTMAGKCNDHGIIYLTRDIPYSEEMLSTIMRRPVNTIRLALSEFQKLGMISIENNFIALLNWEKHQSIDRLEKIQNDARLRVQKHRERQKQICNVTVTCGNAIEENKNREEKNIYADETQLQEFSRFWELYSKKVNRGKCEKLWLKVNPDLYQNIFSHVKQYVAATPDKKYRKDPERYLSNEAWNNEIINSEEKSLYRTIA